jgi:hypothetical protein
MRGQQGEEQGILQFVSFMQSFTSFPVPMLILVSSLREFEEVKEKEDSHIN